MNKIRIIVSIASLITGIIALVLMLQLWAEIRKGKEEMNKLHEQIIIDSKN